MDFATDHVTGEIKQKVDRQQRRTFGVTNRAEQQTRPYRQWRAKRLEHGFLLMQG
jgi:hypothetical protein